MKYTKIPKGVDECRLPDDEIETDKCTCDTKGRFKDAKLVATDSDGNEYVLDLTEEVNKAKCPYCQKIK